MAQTPKGNIQEEVQNMKDMLSKYKPGSSTKPALTRPQTSQISTDEVEQMKDRLAAFERRQEQLDEDDDFDGPDWKEGWQVSEEVEVLRSGGNWDKGWRIHKITDVEITAMKQKHDGGLRKRYAREQFIKEVRRTPAAEEKRKKVTQQQEVDQMKVFLVDYELRQKKKLEQYLQHQAEQEQKERPASPPPVFESDEDVPDVHTSRQRRRPAEFDVGRTPVSGDSTARSPISVVSSVVSQQIARESLPEEQQELYDLFDELGISQKYLHKFFEEELTVKDIQKLRKKQVRSLIPKLGPQTRLLEYIYTKRPKTPKGSSRTGGGGGGVPNIFSKTVEIESHASFTFFDLFDRNNDGKIQLYELINGLRDIGANVKEKDIIPMIQSVDMDGDYELDFMEFQTLMKRRPDFLAFIKENEDKIKAKASQPASSPFEVKPSSKARKKRSDSSSDESDDD